MDEWKVFVAFLWVGIAGAIFSLLFLVLNGDGDHPDSFRTYLLCSAIVLGSSLVALAVSGSRRR